MWVWPWKKKTQRGDANWRLRRTERFSSETVQCSLGVITDISASGMRVICQGKPPVNRGGVLPLCLKFGDGSLKLKAQVRWCRRRGLKRHELGLHFIELKPGMPKVLEAIARFGMAEAAKFFDASASQRASTGHASSEQDGASSASTPPEVMMDLPNYYRILGVKPEATEAEIKARYRKLAVTCHPDRSDAPDAMQQFEAISEAYHVLSDPQRRETYIRMAG